MGLAPHTYRLVYVPVIRILTFLLLMMECSSMPAQDTLGSAPASAKTTFQYSISPLNLLDNFSGRNLDLGAEMRKGRISVLASGALFMPGMRFSTNEGYRVRAQVRFWESERIQQKFGSGHFWALDLSYKSQQYTVDAYVISEAEQDYVQTIGVTRDAWGCSVVLGWTGLDFQRWYTESWVGLGVRYRQVENQGLRNATDRVGTGFAQDHNSTGFDAAYSGFWPNVNVGLRIGLKHKSNT